MPRQYETVTLADANRMLSAAAAKASSLGIAYNIAIADAGGHLVAFVRQDGALIGSIDLAIHKAMTARFFDTSTSELATVAQPGRPLFGTPCSSGLVTCGQGVQSSWSDRVMKTWNWKCQDDFLKSPRHKQKAIGVARAVRCASEHE